jgi:hypothetical protein
MKRCVIWEAAKHLGVASFSNRRQSEMIEGDVSRRAGFFFLEPTMQNESSHLRQKARHREIMERSGALMISDAPD